ncbi:Hypothetical protein SRAE_0000051600 [Strongyloides ratti]|uniref:Uncharacterized protein n=1 Tax=Strongyloides ratti TaxID=34506 RepID=A0A090KZT8_STRRB|nr:Hypothetical protein SRAE_0000051600 [Strongyloides ratti]CEF61392.1 Hypothetical protein SRAE_0000051600 [Strongyloides ratti]
MNGIKENEKKIFAFIFKLPDNIIEYYEMNSTAENTYKQAKEILISKYNSFICHDQMFDLDEVQQVLSLCVKISFHLGFGFPLGLLPSIFICKLVFSTDDSLDLST